MQRGLARMLSHPVGRRLFGERPCLLERLCATASALARLPEGSLGRAYLAHIERFGLDPGKLVELGRRYPRRSARSDEGPRWFADRSELAHDLHHVLTGYGADGLGETALLWFTLRARRRARHGAADGRRRAAARGGTRGRGWARYLWRAWRRGRRAGCSRRAALGGAAGAPLAEVRRLAHIEPPEGVHPDGVRAERSRRRLGDSRGARSAAPGSPSRPRRPPAFSRSGTASRGIGAARRSRRMSGVRVLVGTRKGAFILPPTASASSWDVAAPTSPAGRSTT